MADVLLVDRLGQRVTVASEDVPDALAQGFRQPTDAENYAAARHAQYGTLPQQIATGAEAAGEALTGGASDYLEQAFGVRPEEIGAREEENPLSHATGTGVGLVGSLALEGGLGAEASGAEALAGGAPSIISRIGRAATGAAEEALPAATGRVGRIVNRAVAEVAGSAVQGTAYGLGNVVHEQAIGDPNLTAQAAFEEVGLSALLGGGLGGAGSLATGVLGHLAGKIADAAPEWMEQFEAREGMKTMGARAREFRLSRRAGDEEAIDVANEARDQGITSGFFTTERQVFDRAGKQANETWQQMDNLLKRSDESVGAKIYDPRPMFDKMSARVASPLIEEPTTRSAGDAVATLINEYRSKYETGGITLREMHDMQKRLSDAAYGFNGALDPSANVKRDAYHSLRSVVSSALTDRFADVGGRADQATWQALKRRYQVAISAKNIAEASLNRTGGTNVVPLSAGIYGIMGAAAHGAPGAALGIAAGYAAKEFGAPILGSLTRLARIAIDPQRVAAISTLERTVQQAAKNISSGVSTLVRTGARAGNIARNEVAAGLASHFGKSQEDKDREYEKITGRVAELANSPDTLVAQLQKSTDGLHEHAPDTAQALQGTTARAVQYLNGLIPKPATRGILAPKITTPPMLKEKFMRQYHAVATPVRTILKAGAAGTLTSDMVQAANTVHPETMQAIRVAISAKMLAHPPASSQARIALSMIMGVDLDGSIAQTPRNQAIIAASSPKPPPPKTTGAQQITSGQAALTDTQRTAERGARPA